MKIIEIYESIPHELRVSARAGLFSGFFGSIYQFMTDENVLKFVTALGAFGGVITMFLGWIFYIIKIRKESK